MPRLTLGQRAFAADDGKATFALNEGLYRHAYETVAQAEKRIADHLRYLNEEPPL